MKKEFYYDSIGQGKIHALQWQPEGEVKAVVQILHGIAEYADRYHDFAAFLNTQGILVVAEDHMGHGESMKQGGTRGYFRGGWFTAVDDSVALMKRTMAEDPNVPYFLFGHSMGSFMTRTILAKYPASGITGAVICGTGWLADALLTAAMPICKLVCKTKGEKHYSKFLQKLMFGNYNQRIEHPRTGYDWLTRDHRIVDAYEADPRCGFICTAGLIRDMIGGIRYIQTDAALSSMNKELPVFFIAGGDDPVGDYGAGVRKAAENFKNAGMKQVECKIYPLCRHEILNEINREEVYGDVLQWLQGVM